VLEAAEELEKDLIGARNERDDLKLVLENQYANDPQI
jgi:hypothetical protein